MAKNIKIWEVFAMKKLISLVLAIWLCISLCVPALAHDTGTVGIVTTISSAGDRTAAITSDGSLWMWGSFVTPSIDKRYGGMDMGYQKSPVKIMTDVVSVSCSGGSTAAIKKDGSLWMWGFNTYGGLGTGEHGDTAYKLSPVKIMDDVVAVSCANNHTAAIKTDGSLWLFGNNQYAAIGNGYTGNATREETGANGYTYPIQTIPQKIMDDVVEVSCGDDFTAAIKSDGTLWTWGWNKYGQLGNGGVGDSVTISRRIVESGNVQTVPAKIMDNVVSVSCGRTHAAAIQADGSLWVWGQNDGGCLGFGSTSAAAVDGKNSTIPLELMDDVVSIYCGSGTTAAVKADGSLWMWGWVFSGSDSSQAIGEPTKIVDKCRATNAGGLTAYALRDDGTLYGWGRKQYLGLGLEQGTQNTPIAILSDVALPNGGNPVLIKDVPSSWAKGEVGAAIIAGLVPENLQKNYTKPVSRGDVAQMFINLIEQSSGKTIDEILSEKGVELNEAAFTDTTDKAVLAANALGIIYGTGNNKFSPDGTLTRAQIAAIINRVARALDVDTDGHSHSFTDVSGHWVDSELGWPSSVGIINGVGNNKFSPDAELTTEQAIAITYRAFQVLKA